MTHKTDILICDSNLLEHRDTLESLVAEVATCHWVADPTAPESLAVLERAPIYVGTKFTEGMAAHAVALELVLVGGAGHDGIDKSALPEGVAVANTFNHEGSIAEYALASTVMIRRRILQQSRDLAEGVWASSVYDRSMPQPRTLRGAALGLVGFGHIGQAVWRAFQALGATGRAIKRSATEEVPDGLAWIGTNADLGRLLDESDIVVLCAPLDESTQGLLGAEELARLGAGGVLVNVGRGPLVDENALYAALADQVIAGAVIDVWYTYPDASGRGMPAHQPFWELPNVLMTPHISGVTDETFRGRVHDIAANIHNHLGGRALARVVHPLR